MVSRMVLRMALAFVGCVGLLGCASLRHYAAEPARPPLSLLGSPDAGIRFQISDEGIRNAFEARPQLRLPAAVGVYEHTYRDWCYETRDNERMDTIAGLLGDKEVFSKVTVLSPGFLEGAVTPRNVRLAAAYHKADLTLLLDSDFEVRTQNTILSLLNLTLIGLAIVPSTWIKVESRVTGWLMDTRNGYVYHSATRKQARQRFLPTGWGKDAVETLRRQLAEDNHRQIIAEITRKLKTRPSPKSD